VRNIFKKYFIKPKRYVVEEHQVLMDLPHIANVRHDDQAKLSRQYAHGNEFAYAANTNTIDLNKARGTCLHEILEEHPMGHMFAQG